jgi:hypothetical protein
MERTPCNIDARADGLIQKPWHEAGERDDRRTLRARRQQLQACRSHKERGRYSKKKINRLGACNDDPQYKKAR